MSKNSKAYARQRLSELKAKIADPAHWAKGYFAFTAAGTPTSSRDSEAVCWSLVGAYNAGLHDYNAWLALEKAFVPDTGRYSLATFNDDPRTTHADVMDLIDRAIALCTED